MSATLSILILSYDAEVKKMSLGERLKEARLKMGFSQEDVARRIDTHRTTIGKYEKNECDPSINILMKLIEIYSADANYILFGKHMKVIHVEGLPEHCIEEIYLLISRYLLDDYAYKENIHD